MATNPTDADKEAAAAAAKADKEAAAKADKEAAAAKAAAKTPKPNQPDKFADAAEDGLVDGKVAFLTAVHGRIVHPMQVPLEFDQGKITRVKVDSWVRIQYEAGKLTKAEDDESGARKG